jgi:alkylation response protein AidB-like acyl-CoA dehydrogenase
VEHGGIGEQGTAVRVAATLSRDQFAKRAEHFDHGAIFPLENFSDLHKAGLLGLTVPKKYGGVGADWLTVALTLLEIGRGCSATAAAFNMHCVILDFIAQLGTEEQKGRWFAEVIDAGKLFASITSEPQSSFRHKFVLSTNLTPVDGGFLLNGVKHFGSLGEHASYHFVSGMMEGATSAREGQRSVVVSTNSPGIVVERDWDAVGMRGTASHSIRYDNCFVRQEDCVGGIAALASIDITGFALGFAAIYLGIGEAAFEYVLEYVKTRSFGLHESLSHHPPTQQAIGEMATAIRAARGLLREAALTKMRDDRTATVLAVNQSKYFSAEVGSTVTERAIRLAGGRGILRRYPLERWRRDALCGPVMSPANERCMETVGKILCGLEARTLEYV